VNRADKIKVFRQVSQHTFATIKTINDQHELAIGEPGSDQGKHLSHQFRPCFSGFFVFFVNSLRVGGSFLFGLDCRFGFFGSGLDAGGVSFLFDFVFAFD
jgi:hypothetical protein